MAPPDPRHWTYTDYVCFLRSHGFHNLACLDEFLRWGAQANHDPSVQRPQPSTAILLEFGLSNFRTSDLSDPAKLRLLVREWTKASKSSHGPTKDGPPTDPIGRIIMVNNANPEIVDSLGGLLNLEPAFFASHLADHGAGTSAEINPAFPLASQGQRHQKQFFSIEYPCTFVAANCGKDVDIDKLYCQGNYRRRVEVCGKQGRNKIAMARRKISFYIKKSLDPWIVVVLVDPPLSYFTLGAEPIFGAASYAQRLDVTGYQGGYLDFVDTRRPAQRDDHDFRACGARPMCPNPFDDLCRHWQIMARDGGLNPRDKDILAIMKPAFQIAASECTNFFEYVRSTLDAQTVSTALMTDPVKAKKTLDRCISLDSMLSRYKPILTRTKTFVNSCSELNDDYRALLIDLHHYRAECDSQMQHILAVSQLQDSASLAAIEFESVRQADYSRYLTIIALIYAPFALACAIFSLPHDFAPAAHYFYGFLPATAGVAILFLFLVLPEARDPLPSIKTAFCGKLTRKKLLAKPKAKTVASEKKLSLEEV